MKHTVTVVEQFEIVKKYYNFLIEYNQKVNLTAITQKDAVIIKHFLDSIILLNFLELKTNCKLIDIGTGAGFPGVPLKIVRPDLDIVLLTIYLYNIFCTFSRFHMDINRFVRFFSCS